MLIGAPPPAKPARRRARRAAKSPGPANTLIVMARAPALGRGKRRLAAELGEAQALRIARGLLTRTLKIARDPRWRTELRVTPDRARSPLFPRKLPRKPQGGGDLGARMARALKPHRRAAIVGTDCPGASRREIARAFRALQRNAFAVGPAEDGGFWILAARSGKAAAALMRGVRWSSAHTLDDVIGRMARMPAELATLRDIDTAADWRGR
ncbi:MAG: DUF2064 domain-containing protein [Hyphomonadaceae bacterium]